jgi:lipoteichoic acid synthase
MCMPENSFTNRTVAVMNDAAGRNIRRALQAAGAALSRPVTVGAALALFLLLNAFKCGVFTLYLSDVQGKFGLCSKIAVYSVSFFLVVMLYLMVLKIRFRGVFAAVYVLQAIYISVNMLYFSYFHGYLHVAQYFSLWAETLELMKRSAMPVDPGILVVAVDLLPFAVVLAGYRVARGFNRYRLFRYMAFVPLAAIVWKLHSWNYFRDGTPLDLMNDRYESETAVVTKYGMLVFDAMNLCKFWDNREQIRRLCLGDSLASAGDTAAAERPNYLVLQVESLDAFIVNQKHRGAYVTPYLHSLTSRAVYYPYLLSYHKAGSTSDCEFSCINSVEPLDHFPSIKVRNFRFPNSMAKQLGRAGYEVLLFHGNSGEYFNRSIALRKMGFDFYDLNGMGLREECWGAPDREVINFMIARMNAQQEPFLDYLITMSSHEPFTFIDCYHIDIPYDEIKEKAQRYYYASMSYVDCEIKRCVREARARTENLYVIIYGDHTPGLHNSRYKQCAFHMDGRYFEFVPLLVITPEGKRYREQKRVASFLDIAPTVLGSSGVPFGITTFGGNILATPFAADSVPFRGKNYCRRELFDAAEKHRQAKPTGPGGSFAHEKGTGGPGVRG